MCGEYTQSAPPFVRLASIVTVVTNGPHMLSPGVGSHCQLRLLGAAGLLTKVGSDLDAACGAVGAAVASDVRGEYTLSAPPFVRFHIVTVVTEGPHTLSSGVRSRCQLRLLQLQGRSPKLAVA